jgi:hypothetical protein
VPIYRVPDPASTSSRALGAVNLAGETGVREPDNEKAPEGKIADTGNQYKNLGGPLRSRPAPMLTGEGTPVSPVKPGFTQRTRDVHP